MGAGSDDGFTFCPIPAPEFVTFLQAFPSVRQCIENDDLSEKHAAFLKYAIYSPLAVIIPEKREDVISQNFVFLKF